LVTDLSGPGCAGLPGAVIFSSHRRR
jgi:hypothetical protein